MRTPLPAVLTLLALLSPVPLAAPALALPYTVDPTLLNTQSLGGTVLSIIPSSALNGDNPAEAFGAPSGPGPEDGNFLFADSAPGPDTLSFLTASPVTLYGIRLTAGANGPDARDARRILTAQLTASSGPTTGPINVDDPTTFITDLLFPSPVTDSSFTLTLIREDGAGTRVMEIDALIPEPTTLSLLAAALPFTPRRRLKKITKQFPLFP